MTASQSAVLGLHIKVLAHFSVVVHCLSYHQFPELSSQGKKKHGIGKGDKSNGESELALSPKTEEIDKR